MDTNFIKKEIDDEIMIRFINTGNYFLNKKEYINTIDNFKNIDESSVKSPLDVFYEKSGKKAHHFSRGMNCQIF